MAKWAVLYVSDSDSATLHAEVTHIFKMHTGLQGVLKSHYRGARDIKKSESSVGEPGSEFTWS